MVSLTADDTWLLKDLRGFIEPVEIYDASGKFLGLFVPANLERGKQIYAEAVAKIDRAEMERRLQSKEKGIPFEEVRAHLKLLEAEVERRKAAGEKELTPEEAVAFVRSLRRQQHAPDGRTSESGDRTETDRCPTP